VEEEKLEKHPIEQHLVRQRSSTASKKSQFRLQEVAGTVGKGRPT